MCALKLNYFFLLPIETGWLYGEIRDDMEMYHPCLTQFQNLPMAEKKYNIQLALQTLRTIVALGKDFSMIWILFFVFLGTGYKAE